MNNNIAVPASNQQVALPSVQHPGSELEKTAAKKRRRATLTLAPCHKRRDNREFGQAFGGRLECEGHAVWLEDAISLGVVAYVLNVGKMPTAVKAVPQDLRVNTTLASGRLSLN